MAFAYTSNAKRSSVIGSPGIRMIMGTYSNVGGTTGGDITTGLKTVLAFLILPKGSAVGTGQSAVNETLPLSNAGGVVTIVTNATEEGVWMAFGQ